MTRIVLYLTNDSLSRFGVAVKDKNTIVISLKLQSISLIIPVANMGYTPNTIEVQLILIKHCWLQVSTQMFAYAFLSQTNGARPGPGFKSDLQ